MIFIFELILSSRHDEKKRKKNKRKRSSKDLKHLYLYTRNAVKLDEN